MRVLQEALERLSPSQYKQLELELTPAEQLIFDPTYFAMNVSAQSALHSVFGPDLSSSDLEIFEEEYAFSKHTVEIFHIWDLIDSKPETDRLPLIKGMPASMGREPGLMSLAA